MSFKSNWKFGLTTLSLSVLIFCFIPPQVPKEPETNKAGLSYLCAKWLQLVFNPQTPFPLPSVAGGLFAVCNNAFVTN